MAIRTVEIKCLFPGNYSERDVWEKENGVSLYPSLYVRGVTPGEGIEIAFNGTTPEKRALCRALYVISKDEVKFEGCVVATFSREERVMSDVWASCSYAIVYSPETIQYAGQEGSGFQTIRTGCSEFSGVYDATVTVVDATEEIKAAYAAFLAGKAAGESFARAEREQAAHEARVLAEKRRIANGKLVRVTRGRKVPKGTQGRVFWMKDDTWGVRLGIATSDRKDARGRNLDVAWVAASNCDVVNEATGEVYC